MRGFNMQPYEQHEEMVKTLAKSGDEILLSLTPEDAHLMHMILGICGESGELLDAIKKSIIYRKPLDRENVVEELGDLEFYIAGLRQGLDISRVETLEHNIEKLSKRYENFVYTDQRAQDRADKDL